MYRDFNNEEEIIAELSEIIMNTMTIEEQYDIYCQMMKKMFLSGSTNN